MDGCHAWFSRHVVELPTLYLRHARDHVQLPSKPSTVCSAFNPVNDACYFLRFFGDRSKSAYGLKSSLYVEPLQCAFYPVRYPLNIGYHGKASRVRMLVLWARPWLGSISANLVGYPFTWLAFHIKFSQTITFFAIK